MWLGKTLMQTWLWFIHGAGSEMLFMNFNNNTKRSGHASSRAMVG